MTSSTFHPPCNPLGIIGETSITRSLYNTTQTQRYTSTRPDLNAPTYSATIHNQAPLKLQHRTSKRGTTPESIKSTRIPILRPLGSRSPADHRPGNLPDPGGSCMSRQQPQTSILYEVWTAAQDNVQPQPRTTEPHDNRQADTIRITLAPPFVHDILPPSPPRPHDARAQCRAPYQNAGTSQHTRCTVISGKGAPRNNSARQRPPRAYMYCCILHRREPSTHQANNAGEMHGAVLGGAGVRGNRRGIVTYVFVLRILFRL